MFKKQIKTTISHALSNKDRKALAQQLAKLEYDDECIQYLLKDDNFD